MEGVDDEFNVLPEGGLNEGERPPSIKSVNNEAPVVDAELITVVHPSEFAENIGDSDDAPSENDEMTLIGHSKPHNLEVGTSSKDTGKRKQVADSFGEGPHQRTQKVPPQASKVVGDPCNPLDVDSDPDIHAVLDNTLKRRTRKLMSALSKARASCDAIQEREAKKDKAYAELERKLTGSTTSIEGSSLKRRSGLIMSKPCLSFGQNQDKAAVVSKVVPHVATEFVRSDEMGLLVARLVKVALFHGRCAAFEDVSNLKEPFALEKMPGYRSSSKEEFNQAGDDLANAYYPFLAEATADLYAYVEQLLSKKPRSLQSQPALSHFKPSYSKAPIV
ncbi:hypothetical protein Tco_0116734 [Tanacetum coccineum]